MAVEGIFTISVTDAVGDGLELRSTRSKGQAFLQVRMDLTEGAPPYFELSVEDAKDLGRALLEWADPDGGW